MLSKLVSALQAGHNEWDNIPDVIRTTFLTLCRDLESKDAEITELRTQLNRTQSDFTERIQASNHQMEEELQLKASKNQVVHALKQKLTVTDFDEQLRSSALFCELSSNHAIVELEQAFTALNEQFGGLQNKLSHYLTLDGLTTFTNKLNSEIQTLATTIDDHIAQTNSLISKTQESIKGHSDSIQEASDKMQTLEKSVHTSGQAHAQTKSDIQSLSEQLASMESEIETLRSQKDAKKFLARLADIDAKVDLKSDSKDMVVFFSKVAEMEKEHEEIQKTIGALKQTLKTYDTSFTSTNSQLTAVRVDMVAQEKKIEETSFEWSIALDEAKQDILNNLSESTQHVEASLSEQFQVQMEAQTQKGIQVALKRAQEQISANTDDINRSLSDLRVMVNENVKITNEQTRAEFTHKLDVLQEETERRIREISRREIRMNELVSTPSRTSPGRPIDPAMTTSRFEMTFNEQQYVRRDEFDDLCESIGDISLLTQHLVKVMRESKEKRQSSTNEQKPNDEKRSRDQFAHNDQPFSSRAAPPTSVYEQSATQRLHSSPSADLPLFSSSPVLRRAEPDKPQSLRSSTLDSTTFSSQQNVRTSTTTHFTIPSRQQTPQVNANRTTPSLTSRSKPLEQNRTSPSPRGNKESISDRISALHQRNERLQREESRIDDVTSSPKRPSFPRQSRTVEIVSPPSSTQSSVLSPKSTKRKDPSHQSPRRMTSLHEKATDTTNDQAEERIARLSQVMSTARQNVDDMRKSLNSPLRTHHLHSSPIRNVSSRNASPFQMKAQQFLSKIQEKP
ncbi:hypothetical protein BLNAU_19083 [Blattamonas nauphoetae]|uniref:Uncharacterized protein n=1 Tax=Blattamonas nauphoetae TaxID=2049346 RepID=A0ABQ9X2K6_9EUKA|nr:hypothetical protein BLNAU_19083 [Blattamonas nauphoetae]